MSKSIFEHPEFANAEAARAHLETELWPDGPFCPHCGSVKHYATKKDGKLTGRYRCGEPECRKDFTVTTKTVMESSHIPLHKWLQAFHLAASSKKGFSAHQLHRTLKISYKAAWFMEHRIREAMRMGGLGPLGGEGKTVEIDETYYGPVKAPRTRTKQGKPYKTTRGGQGPANKRIVLSLVERGGSVRSFHIPHATKELVSKIVTENVARETAIMTDESHLYHGADRHFASHDTVNHGRKEYVRGEVTTNTIEGFFGIFKRGMKGVYQHCDEKHLHRYLAEFDFRHSHRAALGFDDEMRASAAIKGAAGKRLYFKKPDGAGLSD
jgi:transposase-like protein